ncbi:MAG: TolC family protein [Synergistaceae bacterium]|jgi:outer membrane protein TolC|nr:TolC family protein [Synergistaceae bacterium]
MKRPKIFAVMAILLAISCAASAEAAQLPLEIDEALDLMLSRNLTLQSLRQEIDKAEAFRLQADGTLTPEVSLSASTGESRANAGQTGENEAALTLSQVIYSGGRNEAVRKQAPQVRSIADLAVEDARNRAAGELFARFYNVLLQERYAETERSAESTSEMHLKEITRMAELGMSNRLEVIRASQQLAANKASLATAEGMYDSAVISLMNYLAIPPEDRRPVSGDLDALAVSGDRESSLASALENRADLKMLENQIEYQRYQIDIERSGSKPKIALGASAGFTDAGRTGSFDDSWRAELSLTVPILDRNTARGNVITAQAQAVQDKIALEQKQLDVKSGVETAWTELETATEHLESAEAALRLAEETFRLAEVGFREGVTPQLDLLSAQTSLTESRLEHLRSLYNRMLAVAALKVTEGSIIEWAGRVDFR